MKCDPLMAKLGYPIKDFVKRDWIVERGNFSYCCKGGSDRFSVYLPTLEVKCETTLFSVFIADHL
jgi:hypothetical protein